MTKWRGVGSVRFLTGVLLWLALTGTAGAAPTVDLYRVQETVPDQSDAALRDAARRGLSRVLVRVTGDTGAPEAPALQPYRQAAEHYLYQYSFHTDTATSDEASDAEDGMDAIGTEAEATDASSGPSLQVTLHFDPGMVEQLIRQAGLTLWSTRRPPVLVWVALDDGDGRRYARPGEDPALFAVLEAEAAARGVPLTYPLLDLQDQFNLSPAQLWQLDERTVGDAASRYEAEIILAGRFSRLSSGEWLGNWLVLDSREDTSRFLEFRDADLTPFLQAAVNRAADTLAARYAVQPSEWPRNRIVLEVRGVERFDDFQGVMAHVRSLTAVREVRPQRVANDRVSLALWLDGDPEQLREEMRLHERLRPEEPEGVTDLRALARAWHFRWVRP